MYETISEWWKNQYRMLGSPWWWGCTNLCAVWIRRTNFSELLWASLATRRFSEFLFSNIFPNIHNKVWKSKEIFSFNLCTTETLFESGNKRQKIEQVPIQLLRELALFFAIHFHFRTMWITMKNLVIYQLCQRFKLLHRFAYGSDYLVPSGHTGLAA